MCRTPHTKARRRGKKGNLRLCSISSMIRKERLICRHLYAWHTGNGRKSIFLIRCRQLSTWKRGQISLISSRQTRPAPRVRYDFMGQLAITWAGLLYHRHFYWILHVTKCTDFIYNWANRKIFCLAKRLQGKRGTARFLIKNIKSEKATEESSLETIIVM